MTLHGTRFLDNLKVNVVDDSNVEVAVVIPSDELSECLRLLESISGVLAFLKSRQRIAKMIQHSRSEEFKAKCQRNIDNYHKRIVAEYDRFIAQGLCRKDAIKQVCAVLRAEKHPWCADFLVRPALIEAGRPGRMGKPRGKK